MFHLFPFCRAHFGEGSLIAKDGQRLEFGTHKILMEDDFKPAVQHQRRVNPKIHEVIKKEVLKLLDSELIYPISDSPWVSPMHCVPKKGGFTVVENEENKLIPARLVMGWCVCTDYRKLNDATRKDHFPLPFMDQMLERLAGNKYCCFLDGFSVVDFDADPRVPLILGRSFLKTRRALIDVYEGELTLRVGKEPITFNLDQTSRYSANYDAMPVNRIDLIDVDCEEYS
uniref:Reverse transcriptase domain-containing protein n=1 Tax=Tanacetum cinerariifolium TaxID=118510 RepID=A0A699K1T1_TANCI|nr:reverse transcriptase domain-containing protein [Tanacetum cinerariifolium]